MCAESVVPGLLGLFKKKNLLIIPGSTFFVKAIESGRCTTGTGRYIIPQTCPKHLLIICQSLIPVCRCFFLDTQDIPQTSLQWSLKGYSLSPVDRHIVSVNLLPSWFQQIGYHEYLLQFNKSSQYWLCYWSSEIPHFLPKRDQRTWDPEHLRPRIHPQ